MSELLDVQVVRKLLESLPENAPVWWCEKCGRLASSKPVVDRASEYHVTEYREGSLRCRGTLNSGTPGECLDALYGDHEG